MTSSRRSILKAGAAAAALTGIGAPHVARAQQKPPRQVRMVPHGDLNVLDPNWIHQPTPPPQPEQVDRMAAELPLMPKASQAGKSRAKGKRAKRKA